jgi:predicted dehydrogenase
VSPTSLLLNAKDDAVALKVAMLGAGPIGTNHHGPAFAATDGVELVAVCDWDEERGTAFAETFDVPWYKELDPMLGEVACDCVDVATNEKLRPQPIIQCFQAGKHVYTEKPLAGRNGQYNVDAEDLPTAHEIIDAWRASGKFFGINFNYRTAPHAKPFKAAIDAGRFGEPVAINVYAHLDCWSHVIDLMRWFNGEVTELTAYMEGQPGDHGRPRSAALKFANGTVGTLVGVVHGRFHQILRIEYLGTEARGTIVDLTGPAILYPEESGTEPEVLWEPADGNWRGAFGQTFTDSVQNFARAVRDGNEPPVTGTDAIRELEIDAALPASAASGGPVTIEHY